MEFIVNNVFLFISRSYRKDMDDPVSRDRIIYPFNYIKNFLQDKQTGNL